MHHLQPRRFHGQERNMPLELDFLTDQRPMHRVKRDPSTNNYKLHVKSIPSRWTEETMMNVFSKCGQPLNIFLSPPKPPNSLRWGFVEYAKFGEAQSAIRSLNNNVLLCIHVAFAKEKSPEDEEDPLMSLLANHEEDSFSPRGMSSSGSEDGFLTSQSLVDPRKIKIPAVYDLMSVDFPPDRVVRPVFDPESVKLFEEAVIAATKDKYEKGACTVKCKVCPESSFTACNGCKKVYYCSENCQKQDWKSHSQICVGDEANGARPKTSGGYSETNGQGAFGNQNGRMGGMGDRRNVREEDNNSRMNDRRNMNERDNNFRVDRRNNRDDERGSFRDRGSFEGRANGNQPEKKSILEERRMRMSANPLARQPVNDRPPNLFGNNRRFCISEEKKPQGDEEEWGSQTKETVQKDPSVSPGINFINKEEAFLQEIKKEATTPEAKIKAAHQSSEKVLDRQIKAEVESTPESVTQVPPATAAPSNDKTAATTNTVANLTPVSPKLPSILNASQYSDVLVVVQSEQEDTYFVGASTFTNTLTEMITHFEGVIHQCEAITPKCGAKGLAPFVGSWYRVEIVADSPAVLAHFIDYGNTDEIQPSDFRRCPKTHIDVPNLVQKIKLAKGTDKKYFNLPEMSEIRVKPVSSLADGTVVVQVEGENYEETSEVADLPPQPTPKADPAPEQLSTSQPEKQVETSVSETKQVSTATASSPPSTGSATTQVDLSYTPSAVDLLQKNWNITFIPNKADYKKNSLIGQVLTADIESVATLISGYNDFQAYMSSLTHDPNFKPAVGDLVGLHRPTSSEWERGQVLPIEDVVGLYDVGGVIRGSQLFKLPESHITPPSLAAILTFEEDNNYISVLAEQEDIPMEVVTVTKTNGRTVLDVTINHKDCIKVNAKLRPWVYEPLETPTPLAKGEKVYLGKVVDSKTLLVSPQSDVEFLNLYQIDCCKSNDKFQSPPSVGDYVSLHDKEIEGYFRCRIDKIEGDDFSLYSVDHGTDLKGKLEDLLPLSTTFRNAPCRLSQIELEDVGKTAITEQAQTYFTFIHEEEKCLKIVKIDDKDRATLTVEDEEETLNSRLKTLLNPPVKPDLDGKFTVEKLPVLEVPMNQEIQIVVTQTDPLYFQTSTNMIEYLQFHEKLQEQCDTFTTPYNPCVNELCLAQYEGSWYRCRCLKETNTGVSVLMLVDYGNIFQTETSGIRQIMPDMVSVPSVAISARIHDLPKPVPAALKARIDELLHVDSIHKGQFVATDGDSYEVVIEAVQQVIKELK